MVKQAFQSTTPGAKVKGLLFLVGGFVLLLLMFWALGVILKEVAPNTVRRFFDRPVMDFIVDLRNGGLTSLMKFFNLLGSTLFGIIVLVVMAFVSFAITRDVRFTVFFLLVLLAAFWIDDAVKQFVTLRRPGVSNLVSPREAGYPDGYVAAAAALAYSIVFYFRESHPMRRSLWLWPALAGAAFLVAFARVYLGVSWPTQVIAGALLGIGWGTVCGTSVKLFFGYQRLWPRRARA